MKSKEKQIEEMARNICGAIEEGRRCVMCELNRNCNGYESANVLYKAGYRKQSEGEWIKPTMYSEHICSYCGKSPKIFFGLLSPYCPNCGAKMKGGVE